MATVPKFGSFKPKASSATGRDIEARHGRKPTHDLDAVDHGLASQLEGRSKRPSHEESRRRRPSHERREHPGSRPEGEPHKGTDAVDKADESSLFFADRRGDTKNVEYGNLHRYSVPQYHRVGYGHCVGARASAKIDRDESTETAVVFSRKDGQGAQHSSRPLSSKLRPQHEKRLRIIRPAESTLGLGTQSDFIALRSSAKRKRESESAEQQAIDSIDYRSIEGRAKPSHHPGDNDLEYASDSDDNEIRNDIELSMRQENAILVRHTKERPSDLQAWVALIEHQAKIIRSGADESSLTAPEKRILADVRLSIYEKAFKHIGPSDPAHETLVLGMIREGSFVWERTKLMAKWTAALTAAPSSILLWTNYLDFVQTDHVSFSYESCKSAYVECLRILHNARSLASPNHNHDISTAQLYVFLRLTSFVRDAGYDELSYALWQLILEYTFFKPMPSPDQDAVLDAMEDFWDSDVPRIGEEGAQGWSYYAQHGGMNTRRIVSAQFRPLDRARPIVSFAEQEAEHLASLHLPADAANDGAMSDPFCHVMFSDMRDVFETLLADQPPAALTAAFLTFMHLPSVSDDGSGSDSRGWQADQYLRTEAPSFASSRQYVADTLINERQTTLSLFHHSFEAFLGHVTASGRFGSDLVRFIDRALERLVSAQPGEDRLAEYYVAYKTHLFPTEASRTAKRLLKATTSSLSLYNAYALTESRREDRAAKADEVWATALEMSKNFAEDIRDDVCLLWHSWIRSKLHCGDRCHALHLLLCMGDDSLTPKQSKRSTLTVAASQKLKAAQCFESGWERMSYKRRYGHAVHFAECHITFDYLVNDLAIEAALAAGRKYRAMLERLNVSGPTELLHQAEASLAMAHIKYRRPYKPAAIREMAAKSMRLFPSNTVFLELYGQVQCSFQIEDRIRVSLRDQVMNSSGASIINWSFAIAEELRRCAAEASGSTDHSVRSTFTRAVQSDSTIKHSIHLWTMWFRFEHPSRHDRMLPPRVLTEGQRKQALQRARQVFLDGLRHLPWSKSWVILGLHAFARDGGIRRQELRQVYDVLAEKEMRVRVELKEMEMEAAIAQET